MSEQIPAAAEPLTETETADLEALEEGAPVVGIIMGSKSDMETMEKAGAVLEEAGVQHEIRVMSAHRDPDVVADYARNARMRGIKVIIAGAGGAAHLPGMAAAMTPLPVLGVPVESHALKGMDSLLSIVQMPAGVPVGTLAIGKAGATNAALLAARILGLAHPDIRAAVDDYLDRRRAALLAAPDPREA